MIASHIRQRASPKILDAIRSSGYGTGDAIGAHSGELH
jgi:hypothetical protein